MIKGFQRLLGTLLGAAAGLGIVYFTYLVNGLDYTPGARKVRADCEGWDGTVLCHAARFRFGVPSMAGGIS